MTDRKPDVSLAKAKGQNDDRDYLKRQTDTPNEGTVRGLNPNAPVDGAFDAEGHRPVLERSRKVR
jgi:hypothetical protein